MSTVAAVCGIAIVSAVLVLVLKGDSPALALLLALAAGLVLLAQGLGTLGGAAAQARALLMQSGMEEDLCLPVAKIVGVSVLVRLTGAFCRDAGQSALAAKVELVGALAALVLSLPLVEQLISLLANWTW